METLQRALAKATRGYGTIAWTYLTVYCPINGFTTDDATQWERRLSIASGGDAVALADRKLAIISPQAQPPRHHQAQQNYRYVGAQLRAAGFDVRMCTRISSATAWAVCYQNTGRAAQRRGELCFARQLQPWRDSLGDGGCTTTLRYVNYLEEKDATFEFGDNYRNTFFIAGDAIAAFAEGREPEK